MNCCDLCNREMRNLLRMKPSEVWGEAYAVDDNYQEVLVCHHCADEIDPQEWATSALGGEPIPL
jgi:hypothetical protein